MTTPKCIALIGSHSPDFIERLSSEGYTIIRRTTYAELNLDDAAFAAVAIIGHDKAFANSVQIEGLLRSFSVLMLFDPSPGILKATHQASDTFVDIEAIQLSDGDPLIIYRIPNEVGVNITLVPTSPESEENSTEYAASESKSKILSVKPRTRIIDQSLSSLSAAINHISQAETGAYFLNSLTPPPNTQFWKKTTLTLIDTFRPTYKDDHTDQRFDVNWTVSLYCYATEANPTRPDFEAQGGEIYVIAVNGGYVSRNPSYDSRLQAEASTYYGPARMQWFMDSVRYTIGGPPLLNIYGLYPSSESGVSEHFYKYDTVFVQTVNLWRNDRKFSHDLRYEDSCVRENFRQTVIPDANELGFSIDYRDIYDVAAGDRDNENWKKKVFEGSYRKIKPFPSDNMRLHGLFVFTSQVVGKTKLTISLSADFMAFSYAIGPEKHKKSLQTKKLLPLDLTALSTG